MVLYVLNFALHSGRVSLLSVRTAVITCGEMESFLTEQGTEVQEYDGALVRRLEETIIVYDDRFEVKFKSGFEIEVVS